MRQNGTMDTMPSTSVNNSNMMVTNQIKMKRLLMCVLLSQLTQAESVAQPNIVLILADDMGYGDLGANHDGDSETPNWINLPWVHAGSSVCSPARAALLSGRLGLRTGMGANFGQQSLYGMSLNEILLPQLLFEAGYSTMALGKWHLGHHVNYLPQHRGFEHWVGIPYSWDMGCGDGENGVDWYDNFCAGSTFRLGCPMMWYDAGMCQGASAAEPGVPLYIDDDIVQQPVNLSLVASQLDTAAVNYINEFAITGNNKVLRSSTKKDDDDKKPFFLFYATPHMHAPMAYAPIFKNASTSKTIYGDALREMDNSVGVVMSALEQGGLIENTLVIFTSDNGPWNIKGDWHLNGVDCVVNISTSGGVPGQGLAGNQGPYNGTWQKNVGGSTGKFTPWEGGHRVPSIFSWPGTLTSIQTHDIMLEPHRNWLRYDSNGLVSDTLLSHLDLVPTLVALGGGTLPSDRTYDGINLLPLFNLSTKYDISLSSYDLNRQSKQQQLLNEELNEELNDRVLLHPGDHNQDIYAVRLGINTKVFIETGSASVCGESYYTDGNKGNVTLIFNLTTDQAEAYPLFRNSSEEALALSLEAYDQIIKFNTSLVSGLQSYTNFSTGPVPSAWACADSSQLSCRILD